MLKFVERCCTKLIHVLVDGFYRTVHMLLTAARILNGICHLIAALFLLIFALVLVHDMGDRVPAANVGAFLIA